MPEILTMQGLLEQLLQMNANELIQKVILSVDVNGETVFRPVTSITRLQEPLFRTPEGLCPQSILTEEEQLLPLEEVFAAGQLLLTYSPDDHDPPVANTPLVDLPAGQ